MHHYKKKNNENNEANETVSAVEVFKNELPKKAPTNKNMLQKIIPSSFYKNFIGKLKENNYLSKSISESFLHDEIQYYQILKYSNSQGPIITIYFCENENIIYYFAQLNNDKAYYYPVDAPEKSLTKWFFCNILNNTYIITFNKDARLTIQKIEKENQSNFEILEYEESKGYYWKKPVRNNNEAGEKNSTFLSVMEQPKNINAKAKAASQIAQSSKQSPLMVQNSEQLEQSLALIKRSLHNPPQEKPLNIFIVLPKEPKAPKAPKIKILPENFDKIAKFIMKQLRNNSMAVTNTKSQLFKIDEISGKRFLELEINGVIQRIYINDTPEFRKNAVELAPNNKDNWDITWNSVESPSQNSSKWEANWTELNPYKIKAKNFLEKLNKNITNQTEIDSIYDAYSEWKKYVNETIRNSSEYDKKVIENITKKYKEFKRKHPINKDLLTPINFNDNSTLRGSPTVLINENQKKFMNKNGAPIFELRIDKNNISFKDPKIRKNFYQIEKYKNGLYRAEITDSNGIKYKFTINLETNSVVKEIITTNKKEKYTLKQSSNGNSWSWNKNESNNTGIKRQILTSTSDFRNNSTKAAAEEKTAANANESAKIIKILRKKFSEYLVNQSHKFFVLKYKKSNRSNNSPKNKILEYDSKENYIIVQGIKYDYTKSLDGNYLFSSVIPSERVFIIIMNYGEIYIKRDNQEFKDMRKLIINGQNIEWIQVNTNTEPSKFVYNFFNQQNIPTNEAEAKAAQSQLYSNSKQINALGPKTTSSPNPPALTAPNANAAATISKKVETPSKNPLESSISQVVLELLKKNYGDYIKDNNEELILYKTTKKNINNKNELLVYNYKTNKFILISRNLFFTFFSDFMNNSVNGELKKYIIFKVMNNYLIIDDNNIYLLYNGIYYVLLKGDEKIIFFEITSTNTINTISNLISSNSNISKKDFISEKDFLNFIGKLAFENFNKNKIREYLKELYEKYKKLSENNQIKYKPILIQKSQKLLSNSATKFGSNAFIEHSVDNKKIKNLLNNRLVPTNSENPQGGVRKIFSNIGSRIKNTFSRKKQNEEPLIENLN